MAAYGINDAPGVAACELSSSVLQRYCEKNEIHLPTSVFDRLTPFVASYYMTNMESPNTIDVHEIFEASLLLLRDVWGAPVANLTDYEEDIFMAHISSIIPLFHTEHDEHGARGEATVQPPHPLLFLRGGGDDDDEDDEGDSDQLLSCPYRHHGCKEKFPSNEMRRFGYHKQRCQYKVAAFRQVTHAPAPPTANTKVRTGVHQYQREATARSDWGVSSSEAVLEYRKATLYRPGTVPDQILQLRRDEAAKAAEAAARARELQEAEEQEQLSEEQAQELALAREMAAFGLGNSEIDDIFDGEGGYESDASGAEEALIGGTEWDVINQKPPSSEAIAKASSSRPVSDPQTRLEPLYIAFVDLLHILTNHNSNLALFDDVVTWIHHFDTNHPRIWENIDKRHKTKRATLLKLLRKRFYRTNLYPELRVVESPHTRKKYSIPVFDFKAVITSLLDDRKINNEGNFNQDNMDPITWRPIRAPPGLPDHYRTTAQFGRRPDHARPLPAIDETAPFPISDIYSGTMIHHGINMHVDTNANYGGEVDCVRPLPVIMFIDESHTDLHGSLKVTPVSLTLASFPIRCRRKKEFWRNVAFLPPMDAGACFWNLSVCHSLTNTNSSLSTLTQYLSTLIIPSFVVGSGKAAGSYDSTLHGTGKTRRPKGQAKEKASVDKLRDYQLVLETAFESFRKVCEGDHFIHIMDDITYLYIPFLLLIIGDAAGNNKLCCHYNSLSKRQVKCFSKSCTCSFRQLTNHIRTCQPITRAQVKAVVDNPSLGPAISQHPVPCVINDLRLAEDPNCRQGAAGITPAEDLHIFGNGLYGECTRVIHNMIGRNKKNMAMKDFIDMLHQRVALSIVRNSDRDLPRSSTRFGFLDTTRVTGKER